MVARPREAVRRESRPVETDHVAQVVAPARLPQRAVHAALGSVVLFRCSFEIAEDTCGAPARQAERGADLHRVRVIVERRRIRSDFDGEARVVTAAAALIAGAAIGGVVGRRAEMKELETVGVVMRIEEIGDLVRDVLRRRRRGHAENEQAVEPGRERRGGNRDSKRHALGFGNVEVDHPLHALVDDDRLVACARGRRLRVRSHRHRLLDVAPTRGDHRSAARLKDRVPVIGHEARHGRAPPRRLFVVADDRDLRERERMRQRLTRRRGRCRPLRLVGRLEHMENPRGALVAEAIRELPPRRLLRFDVVAGAPEGFPGMPPPFELGARELALVRIEMDRVRVDPHAQLAASVGLREEPRLQSHRQQRQRLIARAKPLLHQRGQRHVGARQREARSEQRGGHGRCTCLGVDGPASTRGSRRGKAAAAACRRRAPRCGPTSACSKEDPQAVRRPPAGAFRFPRASRRRARSAARSGAPGSRCSGPPSRRSRPPRRV